ncbi:hypothetical protein Sjap_018973 [Stephania japonica]|uniref:Cation efflux protein transmembrane domain-containing protein n=1 Tax=Stephania japonica TaxID=461633 RepID=A0AAP0EYK4_9MAGN
MQRKNICPNLMRKSRIFKALLRGSRLGLIPQSPARILLQPSEIAGIQRPHLLRFVLCSSGPLSDFTSLENRRSSEGSTSVRLLSYHHYSQRHDFFTKASEAKKLKIAEAKKSTIDDHSQRAVTTALWANFFVFSLKFGVWLLTSSHVMLAEMVHSVADFANQALLAYGLSSSRRAPDAMHPYGASLVVAIHAVRKGVPPPRE